MRKMAVAKRGKDRDDADEIYEVNREPSPQRETGHKRTQEPDDLMDIPAASPCKGASAVNRHPSPSHRSGLHPMHHAAEELDDSAPMFSPPVGGAHRAARKLLNATQEAFKSSSIDSKQEINQAGWLKDLGSRVISLPPSQGGPGSMTNRSVECTAEEWRLMAAPLQGESLSIETPIRSSVGQDSFRGEQSLIATTPIPATTPIEERSMAGIGGENGSLLLYPGGHSKHQVSHEAAWAAAIRLPSTP